MAGDGPISGLPDQREIFEHELEEVLLGELGRVLVAEGLSREWIVAQAVAEREHILSAAEPAWEQLRMAGRFEAEMVERSGRPIGGMRIGRLVLAPRDVAIALLGGVVAAVLVGTLILPGSAFPAVVVGLAAALLSAVLTPPTVAILRGGHDDQFLLAAAEAARAQEVNYRTVLRTAGIEAWIREQLNNHRERSYSTVLDYADASGLAEVDDPRHEIPTEERRRLERLIAGMPGGAIGISGPRGVGKTTMIRSLCRDQGGEDGRPVLATVVDAPVHYDARDFVLHLFARVCEEVIGPDRVRGSQGPGEPLFPPRLRTPGAWVLIGPALVILGLLVLFGAGPKGPFQHISSSTWGVISLGAGYLITAAATVLGSRPLLRALRNFRPSSGVRSGPGGEHPYTATAAIRLREIRFQQSFSSGWSGSLRVPIGLEGGLSASSELAEKQLSFPDVVAHLREFLAQVASERQVRIGIDELDKMDAEDARRFLNEIKAIFRVPECFFFVSISEDAMSHFERRGLPFRDVFDSSFDEVASLPNLRFDASRALLDRRIVGLPVPFACLLHCLSGGLPRDLIRAARRLLELQRGEALIDATARLLGEGVRSKARATAIAARPLGPESGASILRAWLAEVGRAEPGAEVLLAICRDSDTDLGAPLAAPVEDEETLRARRQVEALAAQMLASIYLAATLLELFVRFEDREQVDLALAPGAGGEAHVDRLADVVGGLSLDISGAWESLSRLRLDLGLDPLESPRAVVGAMLV